jgi:hypothetical protein
MITASPNAPLYPCPLVEAIEESCIPDLALVDHHYSLRLMTLVSGIATSVISGIAYAPVSLQLPGGIFFAIANTLGFSKLSIWAIRATAQDLFGPKGNKEMALLDRNSNGNCVNIAAIATSTVIAILSQLPTALPMLDYGGQWKVPGMLCVLASGMLVPIRSLQLSINRSIQLYKKSREDTGEKLERLRTVLINAIELHQTVFRKQSLEEKEHWIASLQHNNMPHSLIGIALHPAPAKPVTARDLRVERIAKATGLLLTGSLQTGLALYTFAKTQQYMVSSPAAAALLAGSVVLSGIYLSGQSIISTTHRIANAALSRLTHQKDDSLAEQLRPWRARVLQLMGFVIDAGSLGATVVIWGDFYQNNLPAKTYFTTALCLAYFLFLFTSTTDMIDEAIEEDVRLRGSKEEKMVISYNDQFSKMKKIIANSSAQDLALFLESCPPELRSELLVKIDGSLELLRELEPILI